MNFLGLDFSKVADSKTIWVNLIISAMAGINIWYGVPMEQVLATASPLLVVVNLILRSITKDAITITPDDLKAKK